ncbi:6-bladed beta-propeller [Aurantivibrio plasticivorans]
MITSKKLCTFLCFSFLSPSLLSQSWQDLYQPTANHGESPYNPVSEWLKPFAEEGFVWGSHPGLVVESAERIFVIQRGELHVPDPKPSGFTHYYGSAEGINALRVRPEQRVMRNVIFVVNSEGKLLEVWNQWDYLFANTAGPHKVAISPHDPERKVWVVNDARHQIHAFSNDGEKLLMSLGTWNESAEDETHLGRPQDIAFLSNGDIIVADGIENSRVVRFDKNGKFISAWGSKGSKPGQFDVVHAVAVDKQDRIYVADRSNDRIQVFDKHGKLLNIWNELNFPNHILITENQDVWVADNQPVRLIKFDTEGNRLFSWDAHGRGAGEFEELHEFSVDNLGNWYGADNLLGRSQKFVPKASANPKQLIQAPVPYAKPE